MSFCLRVSSSSSFLSLARTIVRTLVCTHTHARVLFTYSKLFTWWPQSFSFSSVHVLEVNEVWLIGCPSSLGSFSSATTHTFVCLVLLIFICPFCVHMCLPPFRAEWRSHMPPFGEACVCKPWNHRDPFGFLAGGMAAVSLAMPTKLRDSAGRNVDAHSCTCNVNCFQAVPLLCFAVSV